MFEQITKTRILFLLSILIGSIGAIGQSYLLHHELVNCYPYKMMDWEFYKVIANFGIYFSPILAVICGILLSLKKQWLAAIIPVVLCPLFFSIVFKIFSIMRFGTSQIENETWNFDGKNPAMAAQDFFFYSLNLAIVGGIIGGVSSFILYRFSRNKNLP